MPVMQEITPPPGRTRRRFTKEFKADAVALIRRHRTVDHLLHGPPSAELTTEAVEPPFRRPDAPPTTRPTTPSRRAGRRTAGRVGGASGSGAEGADRDNRHAVAAFVAVVADRCHHDQLGRLARGDRIYAVS